MKNSTLTAAILSMLARNSLQLPFYLGLELSYPKLERQKQIGNILSKKSRKYFLIKQPNRTNFFRTSAKSIQEK